MAAYRFTNLTSAISDDASPLRRYLATEFPHVRGIERAYRESAGPLRVRSLGAKPSTLGAAFDFVVRYTVDPDYNDEMLYVGFGNDPRLVPHVMAVIGTAQQAAAGRLGSSSREVLYRACWALALCADVYRQGRIQPGGTLERLLVSGRFTRDGLLECAPPNALEEMAALDAIATDAFYPRVRGADYFALGPRFDASRLCAADADLIVGDVLIELKTKLGRKDDEGQRFDVLQTKDLYQVVAYALFDRSDEYGIRDVAIYSARYGHYFERRLEALLDELAGRPVDLPAERTRVWQILATA